MKIKKQVPKPANWQDFEDLCKVLWGQIWNIPDKIKKNGRLGDNQKGIDIIGRPVDNQNYYGIQCKGKDDYSNQKLSKSEIDKEIKNALTFKPSLEVFIIASTSNKNSEIESYVYEKDMESRAKGEFEILLYCWEDIVDLIVQNQKVYAYYTNSIDLNSDFGFEMLFSDGNNEAVIKPQFYRKKIETLERTQDNINAEHFLNNSFTKRLYGNTKPNINNSWDGVEMIIENTGNKVIEDYQIDIWTNEGEIRGIKSYLGGALESIRNSEYSSLYTFDDLTALYKPKDDKPLIQKGVRKFEIFFLSQHKEYSFELFYHLKARDFDKEGSLLIHVKPEFKSLREIKLVNNKSDANKEFFELTDIMTYGGLFGL